MVDVSIVIPAFDEERRLPATLGQLVDELPEWFGTSWEIVVVDDGSSDATLGVARAASATAPLSVIALDRNTGKGAALRRGVAQAQGAVVVLLDADLPVDTATLRRLVAATDDADLVLASRRLAGARMVPPQPWVRRWGARGFIAAVRLLGYRRVSDPQCGAKALRRSTVGPVVSDVTSRRFAFDVEMIERSHRAGLRVVELPVTWRHSPGSSVRPVRDALATLRDLAGLRRALGIGADADPGP